MTGFVPNEGEALRGQLVWKRALGDRDADLELALFTNASPGESITAATLTEPAGNGYARQTLTDADWSEGDNGGDRLFSHVQKTFTPSGGNWSGVQGYAVITRAATGTPRLLAIEVDPAGPLTITPTSPYKVTLNMTEQ